jgi:transcriptional regulator with GAF, ATPase, and Fis domain
MVEDNGMTARFSELSRSLRWDTGVDDTLQAMVAVALNAVPGARYAGISLVEGRTTVTTRAATDDVVTAVDRAQYDTGQGPCLTALYHEPVVQMHDVARELRWPGFTSRIANMNVRSMLSFQLFTADDRLGALNLYAIEPNAFTVESEQVGSLFAVHAAVVLGGAQRYEKMNRALGMRDLIGQAKGILMERHKLTGDEAFALMVRVSQSMNVKLRDIAVHLTRTGELGPPAR